jgi:ketosteroid isomerase-like protein
MVTLIAPQHKSALLDGTSGSRMLYHARVTSPSEAVVLAANQAFYDAFAKADADAMARLWAREHLVACIHPGWIALHGRDAVVGSWRAILGSPEPPQVRASDATAVIIGEAAFVTCVEHIGQAELAATNVFALEQGEWRIVHHHAGPMSSERPSRKPSSSPLN